MTTRRCDIAILGGGLAGGLLALALARKQPDLDVVLIERQGRLGGNHVWSFFGADIADEGLDLLAPMVAARWQGYSVAFPAYARSLTTSYQSMTSDLLDRAVRAALPESAILTGRLVASAMDGEVWLADGARIHAGVVIDTRGFGDGEGLRGGWQKFLGQRLKLTRPHGLVEPIVMDATVEQIDGFRFVYCLPFGPDEIFVEDTYYSDDAMIDRDSLARRIADYAQARGWQVIGVLAEEQGALPVVAGGTARAFRQPGPSWPTPAGTRAGLFHAVTSYSVPDAVRFALAFAERASGHPDALRRFCDRWLRRHWAGAAYYRLLSAMMFCAAVPRLRYRVLEHFYRLDQRLIERFYAGRSTFIDKARVLSGKPPVPLLRAMAVVMGALTGIGPRPRPLQRRIPFV